MEEKRSKLQKRVKKWDLILNDIHECLKYLHDEFDRVYVVLEQLKKEKDNGKEE